MVSHRDKKEYCAEFLILRDQTPRGPATNENE